MIFKKTIDLKKYLRKNMNIINFTYDTEKKRVWVTYPIHFNVLDIPLIKKKVEQSILKNKRIS
jgi:hypothetical protein